MTREEIREIVDECKAKDLTIRMIIFGERYYLQVSDDKWSGRKWSLSKHMTPGEVVQTAMAAVLAWHEHEAREAFTFKDRAIFSPHIQLDVLWNRAQFLEYRE